MAQNSEQFGRKDVQLPRTRNAEKGLTGSGVTAHSLMAGSHTAQHCRTFSNSLSSVLSADTATVSSRTFPTVWALLKQKPDLFRVCMERVKAENQHMRGVVFLLHIQAAAHVVAFMGQGEISEISGLFYGRMQYT